MTIEWWHWIVLGVGLVLLELAAPAVFLIWFGLGAILVGLLVAVAPSLAVWVQLLLWSLCSVAALIVWTRVFKASAERDRKAMVARAEGGKQAMILAGDGRLESAKRDAFTQVTLAEASDRSIQKVAQAARQSDAPLYYLLGERYVNQLGKLAESANSKIFLLPADLHEALRGLLAKR